MKRFISIILLLSLMSGKTMAETVISQTEDPSWGVAILLAGSILILVLLALWLLKNSYHLKETINDVDTDGKSWLNTHLKDLDGQQVNILIKRQHAMRNQTMRVENQNKQ